MLSQYQRATLQLLDVPIWQLKTRTHQQPLPHHPLLTDIQQLLNMQGSDTANIRFQLGKHWQWEADVFTLKVAPEQLSAQDKKQLWQWLQTQDRK